ncbi:von Willebrand factor type A domain-containing protein [Streptomyces sp. NBC_00347]|uniref:vWA domain-containing protein n=1 Tax=Streptomyces sp. NBC_00347 TaxID=2975721 RepID=UPI002250FD1B|nr:von Willebrand factor type A domain-containing protein [Streptomyces sp. NBC_00347]MCX5126436.1 von Willebrand factor type A domain-containing protein [Streptomyces sp. NBC_00347]
MEPHEDRMPGTPGTPRTLRTPSASGASRRTRPARRRTYGRLAAALLAGGLLLTGCGAGGADRTSDGEWKGGDAKPRPSASRPGGESTEGESDGRRPTGPPADYLSTFALDVDTASYGYARRTLADGKLPDPATVRPEEFVNSFRQDYQQPDGDGFSVTVDGARTTEANWSLVRVGLATRVGNGGADGAEARPPAALTFVVDVSGSMAEPGRLDLVRTSMGLMTDELREDDSVAVVTFSGKAETRLPMTRVEGHRDRIHEVIAALRTADSTNVEAGVTRGYEVAVESLRPGATNRVVLLSDALANTGATSADTILNRIGQARTKHGITLFGVGVGSEYNDAFMEQLADRGDGHTTYVSDKEGARKVFCQDLPAQVQLRARDAKAQVAFDPQTVERFRLIGYDDRRVADGDFRNNNVDGGEVGSGHSVTALYAVRLRPGASGHLATATVRWLDPRTRAPHEESGKIEAAALSGDVWASASTRFQVTAVAAYFASALRERDGGWERVPGAVPLGSLAGHADRLAGSTEDPAVRQLAQAVRQARGLTG